VESYVLEKFCSFSYNRIDFVFSTFSIIASDVFRYHRRQESLAVAREDALYSLYSSCCSTYLLTFKVIQDRLFFILSKRAYAIFY